MIISQPDNDYNLLESHLYFDGTKSFISGTHGGVMRKENQQDEKDD